MHVVRCGYVRCGPHDYRRNLVMHLEPKLTASTTLLPRHSLPTTIATTHIIIIANQFLATASSLSSHYITFLSLSLLLILFVFVMNSKILSPHDYG